MTAASSSTAGSTGPVKVTRIAVTPKNGQSSDQEARDRYDCYRSSVAQTGFDPLRADNQSNDGAQQYMQAQKACFESRGYAIQ